jgi:hypothetical protein
MSRSVSTNRTLRCVQLFCLTGISMFIIIVITSVLLFPFLLSQSACLHIISSINHVYEEYHAICSHAYHLFGALTIPGVGLQVQTNLGNKYMPKRHLFYFLFHWQASPSHLRCSYYRYYGPLIAGNIPLIYLKLSINDLKYSIFYLKYPIKHLKLSIIYLKYPINYLKYSISYCSGP